MSNHSNTPLTDLTLNEGARPKAPEIGNGATPPTHNGRHLAAIHRMHLGEVSKARQVLSYVETGEAAPEALLNALKGMTLTENMRVFGSICGQECQMLQFHHNAEEHHMFPELEAQKIDGLTAVVRKLREEHEVVHELLDRLHKAALDLINTPEEPQFKQAAQVFDKLETVIRSHFSYEETELRDALDHLIAQI